jgi:hypothetical protein
MNYDLQLRKGGKLFTNEWNVQEKNYIEREVQQEDLLFHLYDSICFSKNVTLRDIFLLMARNISAFSSVVGCPFLEDLIEEALSDPKMGKDKNGLAILKLSRILVIEDGELRSHFEFHGIGQKECYALEFTPINELVLYTIILNEVVVVEDCKDENKIYLKANKAYTLADILVGIIDELAFMGPPDVREFALEELKKRCEEIPPDNKVENYRTFTIEDFERKMEEEKENNKVPCGMCGEDSRAQCFEKPRDICKKCFEKIREN